MQPPEWLRSLQNRFLNRPKLVRPFFCLVFYVQPEIFYSGSRPTVTYPTLPCSYSLFWKVLVWGKSDPTLFQQCLSLGQNSKFHESMWKIVAYKLNTRKQYGRMKRRENKLDRLREKLNLSHLYLMDIAYIYANLIYF